jgi:acetoin utilization deacetylase AcuC-like enzyme
MLREALESDGRFDLREGPFARPEALLRVHHAEYVRNFVEGALDAAALRRIGFPWSPGLVNRTMASVGSTVAATAAALRTGLSGTLAGGTHHAFREEGSGFCVFNDIAVAAECARSEAGVRRIAVIDLDVHQGDGTAAIFEDDPDVFTLSLHGARNFPFRKQTSTLDVEFPDGTTDAEYLRAMEGALESAWAFHPDLVFFQAGVDGLASDKLGRLALSREGLAKRDRIVIAAAMDLAIPLVITIGGGYSEPIELTAEAHAQTFRIAADLHSTSST